MSQIKSAVLHAAWIMIFGLIGYGIYLAVEHNMICVETRKAAKECLRLEQDMVADVRGLATSCHFHRGIGANTATASNEATTQTVVDYNVSRIVGSAAGKSVKQAAKGFWEGLRSKSKHEKEQ